MAALVFPLLFSFQFSSFAWAQASLIPPSTFGTATIPATTSLSTSNNGTGTTATPTNTADFPSLTGFSTCVATCLSMGVASANCTTVVDVSCFCNNPRFTREIVDCVSAGCPAELGTAESLSQRFCDVANSSSTLSFPSPTGTSLTSSLSTTSNTVPTNTSSTPINNTSTSGSTTSTDTPSSAAAPGGISGRSLDKATFLGMGVSLLGVFVGVYLIE